MSKCIAAHTGTAYANYPAYINASRQDDGSVKVITRSLEDKGNAEIVMDAQAWKKFVEAIVVELPY